MSTVVAACCSKLMCMLYSQLASGLPICNDNIDYGCLYQLCDDGWSGVFPF